MKRNNKTMNKINKTELDNNLKIVASFFSPKAKAIVYLLATIAMVIVGVLTPIVSIIIHGDKAHQAFHAICPMINVVLLGIQQAFNGENWRKLKKTKEAKANESTITTKK